MTSVRESMLFSSIDSGIVTSLRSFVTPSSSNNVKKDPATGCRQHHSCSLPNEKKPDPGSEIGAKLEKIYGGKYGSWLRSYGVIPSWETHHDSVEYYLWHGYRPNPSSFIYCIKSAFYPTNETLNFWTHFIPCVMMMFRTYRIFTTIHDPTNPIFIPFWIHCFGCCYVMFVSSCAHMFNSVSGCMQELCMCCDYSAISAYGITNVIAYELYVCPRSCVISTDISPLHFILFFTLIGYLCNLMSCASRHPHCPHRKIFRSLPTMTCYLVTSLPCILRFITSTLSTSQSYDVPQACRLGSGDFPKAYLTHLCMFLMAAYFNISRFPEKKYPGYFDIIGHSHQFFHVFIALGLYTQSILVENAMNDVIQHQKDGSSTAEEMSISNWTTWYPIMTFTILSLTLVWKCSRALGSDLEKRRKTKTN